MKLFIVSLATVLCLDLIGQCYWQQKADYLMDIDFNGETHRYKGKQTITYTNNSPDTLFHLFYHLYFNAFQPGSEMDERSRSIADPDPRVGDRISKLTKNEIGYLYPSKLLMNGRPLVYQTQGTILEVTLGKNIILPGQTVKLDMEFDAQVPVQIRRSGRNNREGIDYSMAQWYPKLCEYDHMGWHSNPYIAREFYGIWGNFDVTINIASKYILAATGHLQNANEIGYGYADVEIKKRPEMHKWHFKAENVHDFLWAADPEYKHTQLNSKEGIQLHFFYKENEKTKENWERLPAIMDKAISFMNKRYGKYPYTTYSFIQGGDGGMEYPMATLITGERKLMSLVGVSIHEWMHSWYQNVLATNEALYPWMDEGFTSFGSSETMDYLIKENVLVGKHEENPMAETIAGYIEFAKSGVAEPISQHSDHYVSNTAYGVGSYTKGQLCLVQLEYIMGKEVFAKALLRYFEEWKFKHPHPNDFFRIMEKESKMELDWFREYWINTTQVTDYKIDTIINDKLTISRVGMMPMPIDIEVSWKNGQKEMYYIPLVLMRGAKMPEKKYDDYHKLAPWPWATQTYSISLTDIMKNIEKIVIDPSGRLVDVEPSNNVWLKTIEANADERN